MPNATIRGATGLTVTEDDDYLPITAALTVSDPDQGESAFLAATDVASIYGRFSVTGTGSYTYQIGNGSGENSYATIQGLKSNQTLTDSFVIRSIDGTEQVIEVSIQGREDDTTFGGAVYAPEDGIGRGEIYAFDDDFGDASFIPQSNVETQYGRFSIDAQGSYTFTTIPGDERTQFLPEGEYIEDSVRVTAVSGASANIPIRIFGTPDPEVITSDGGGDAASLKFVENGVDAVTTVVVHDVDSGGPALNFTLRGADANLFQVSDVTMEMTDVYSVELSFKGSPDFEHPGDADHNNIYDVTVDVGSDSQNISVQILDVTEANQPSHIPSEGPDYLTGTSNKDVIEGNGGDDLIHGEAGNDILRGGADDDVLHGGLGNDQLGGGFGDDVLYGDAGRDQLWGNDGNDILHGGDEDDLLYGQSGNDILYGDAGNDSLDGQGGEDVLFGGAGSDVLRGGSGNDVLNGEADNDRIDGGDGNDVLQGGSGDDQLRGGTAVDVIDGGANNDRLFGGTNLDRLTGGLGNDGFVFDTALSKGNIDTIIDFTNTTGNNDYFELENLIFDALKDTGVLNTTAFAANLTGVAEDSDDRIVYQTDTGKLFYDADGNGSGSAIQFALVANQVKLTAADFFVI